MSQFFAERGALLEAAHDFGIRLVPERVMREEADAESFLGRAFDEGQGRVGRGRVPALEDRGVGGGVPDACGSRNASH